jgi:hypothetical protein
MNDDIPKISFRKRKQMKDHSGDSFEEGSILIPRINPDGSKKKEEGNGIKDVQNDKKQMKEHKKNKRWFSKKYYKILGILVLIILVFLSISGILVYRIYKKALVVKASTDNLITAAQAQDLPRFKDGLNTTEKSLEELRRSYKSIAWMRFIPYFGGFVKDGQHGLNAAKNGLEAGKIVVDIVEPYADIIGLIPDGESIPSSGEETTKERLDFIVKTIPDVIPRADDLIAKVKLVKEEVDQIDPGRYPEQFAGKKVQGRLKNAIELVDLGSDFVIRSKPLLEMSSYMMGAENGPRNYLVLFQNDKELRPTGGFITAYTLAEVDEGRFDPAASDDIYNLDNNYTPSVKAPDPIVKYIKGPYIINRNLKLRDMNWDSDFEKSMELFAEEVKKAGIGDFDGIIAVDTQLLVNLLDAMGPIGVSGYGEFSTKIVPECNCPQVIYELESFADVEGPIVWSENTGEIVYAPANYDNRKKIIGPLMNSILSNAMGQSKEKLPKLFDAVFTSLVEKHVLFYMVDDKAQNAVRQFGIAGTVTDYDDDYLFINDANLGGRKSNLYVTQEVLQEIEMASDDSIEKTVTITYKNPEKYDGWLNSELPNWVRIYIPKNITLLSVEGLEDKRELYEEYGKSVVAGYFKLRPQGVYEVKVRYKLPFKTDGKRLSMLIQKQPGKDRPLYIIKKGNQETEFFLKSDKEITLDLF